MESNGVNRTQAMGLTEAMDRRRVVRMMAGAGFVAAAASIGLIRGASAANFFRTTSALNLRTKARTNAPVKLVMPANALVVDLGVSSNGFRKVSYQGVRGYASADYLTPANGGSSDPITIIGTAVTTSSVNLRYGPSGSSPILAVLPKGKSVQIGSLVTGGYRQVKVDGEVGFIYDDYLAANDVDEGPATFKTTTAVNMREQASTSAKVIMVVPAGAVVTDYDLVLSNGFRGVEYKGKTGWISDAYLD